MCTSYGGFERLIKMLLFHQEYLLPEKVIWEQINILRGSPNMELYSESQLVNQTDFIWTPSFYCMWKKI